MRAMLVHRTGGFTRRQIAKNKEKPKEWIEKNSELSQLCAPVQPSLLFHANSFQRLIYHIPTGERIVIPANFSGMSKVLTKYHERLVTLIKRVSQFSTARTEWQIAYMSPSRIAIIDGDNRSETPT